MTLIDRHVARLKARHPLSPEEEEVVRALPTQTTRLAAGDAGMREGELLGYSSMLIDGFMGRYKDLSDGQRQITELQVPGDFTDLHGFTLKRLDHTIAALTDCQLALVPHERLTALTEAHPRLARLYWFSTNLDAAVHREWELSLGRRSAEQRVAAVFCELQARLALIGLADESGYDLPITQVALSECVGLTAVHVNRMLRQLRERGLATFAGGRVQFHDLAGLRALAEFDDGYLYLDPEPL